MCKDPYQYPLKNNAFFARNCYREAIAEKKIQIDLSRVHELLAHDNNNHINNTTSSNTNDTDDDNNNPNSGYKVTTICLQLTILFQ